MCPNPIKKTMIQMHLMYSKAMESDKMASFFLLSAQRRNVIKIQTIYLVLFLNRPKLFRAEKKFDGKLQAIYSENEEARV